MTKSKTDWNRLDKITDEEIEEAVRNDPDAAPIVTDMSDFAVVWPKGMTQGDRAAWLRSFRKRAK